MIDVHTGINYGDDARATDAKPVLRVLKADDLGRWLGCVAVPDDRAVIIHRGMVVEARGNRGQRALRDGQKSVRLHADDSEQRFDQVESAVYQIREEIVGGGNQKSLPNLAIEAPLHLT